MQRILLLSLLLCGPLTAQVKVSGAAHLSGSYSLSVSSDAPVIGSVAASPSASSIAASWTTQSSSSSMLACGTTSGTYPIAQVAPGAETAVLYHQAIVTGLAANTAYFCRVQSVNTAGTASATFTATTTAAAATTPITSVTLGTIIDYNTITPGNVSQADGMYAATCANGKTYFSNGDANIGWAIGGVPAPASSNLQINVFVTDSPLAGQRINPMAAYGEFASGNGDDGRSPKVSGMWCQGNVLYAFIGRQEDGPGGDPPDAPGAPQTSPSIVISYDFGATWANFQNPHSFAVASPMTSPASASILGTTTKSSWGSETPVQACHDDGTVGYFTSCNRHHNHDAYVYHFANEGCAIGGGDLYVSRQPRVTMPDLPNTAANRTYYKGGDGNLDTSWSASESDSVSMYHVAQSRECSGPLGQQSVIYFPTLNRYLTIGYYWPAGFQVAPAQHTIWTVLESPNPWGPWTNIGTIEDTAHGFYNPVFLPQTVSGNTVTVMFTGDYLTYDTGPSTDIYRAFIATLTANH